MAKTRRPRAEAKRLKEQIRAMLLSGASQRQVARELGAGFSTIGQIYREIREEIDQADRDFVAEFKRQAWETILALWRRAENQAVDADLHAAAGAINLLTPLIFRAEGIGQQTPAPASQTTIVNQQVQSDSRPPTLKELMANGSSRSLADLSPAAPGR